MSHQETIFPVVLAQPVTAVKIQIYAGSAARKAGSLCSGRAEVGKTHTKVNHSIPGKGVDRQEAFLPGSLKRRTLTLRRRSTALYPSESERHAEAAVRTKASWRWGRRGLPGCRPNPGKTAPAGRFSHVTIPSGKPGASQARGKPSPDRGRPAARPAGGDPRRPALR